MIIGFKNFRNKQAFFAILLLSLGLSINANAVQPGGTGPHYELKIIGFANCTMDPTADPGTYPNCFNGQPPPGGNVIFIPLKTTQENVCQDGTSTLSGTITTADLYKGVRILVSDGPKMQVLDKDATDGTATFQIPNGCYDVYATAQGKPNGCADIDTLICIDSTTGLQVACDPNLANNTGYNLVGHVDVDRSTGKPKWTKVTDDLLGTGGYLVQNDGYYDFFWQIFNNNVRVISLRIQSVACAG